MSDNNSRPVVIELGELTLTYRVVTSNIIHCSCSKDRKKPLISPLGIKLKEQGKLECRNMQAAHYIGNERLNAEVDIRSGTIRWTHGETGRLLFEEAGRELEEIPVYHYTSNGESLDVQRVKTVDGERNFIQNLVRQKVRDCLQGQTVF